MAGALGSGFMLPEPGIPSGNPPGAAQVVWALPGALGALGASYLYGARSDNTRNITRT